MEPGTDFSKNDVGAPPMPTGLPRIPNGTLAAAEKGLAELTQLVDNSRRVDGKLSQATIRKAQKLLGKA